MARPRKPTATKILQGTFRKDRETQDPTPREVDEVRAAPSHLGKHGKRLWRDLAGDMVELGMVTVLDWATLELCCSSYDQYLEAKDLVYKPVNKATGKPKGRTLGEYMEHGNWQELRIMNQSFDRYMAAAKILGLSPTARKNIDIQKPKDHEISETERILNEVGL
jgi:P27 family predicted phage terminase small subunit